MPSVLPTASPYILWVSRSLNNSMHRLHPGKGNPRRAHRPAQDPPRRPFGCPRISARPANAPEHRQAKRILLHLPADVESCPFETELQPADPAEERAEG